ncbi:MAG: phosphatidate cytidylyltransferase [Pseudomonadota bacterium]
MLKTRIITAVTMVFPLILLLVFSPQPWPLLIGFALYTLAAWEWSQLMPGQSTAQRAGLTTAYVTLLAIVTFAVLEAGSGNEVWFGLLGLLVLGALGWWLIAAVLVVRYPFSPPTWLIAVSGIWVIVPAFAVVAQVDSGGWGQPARLLILTFLIVWAADIGAYFCGRALGRHKLAPRVSPGKTWEGLVGGAILALVVVAGLAHYFEQPLLVWLPLTLVVVLASVIGDLIVSLFKRHASVKDMGRVFPGHGGILDRFDSFSAAAPVLYGLLAVTGLAPSV